MFNRCLYYALCDVSGCKNYIPAEVPGSSDAATPETQPTGDGKIVLFEVMHDLMDRAKVGREKYGTYLKTNNGRDALMDAYQEMLDACMYLRQAIMEREVIR